MNSVIAVIAEHSHGRVNPVTYEAIACAYEIHGIKRSSIVVIVVGDDPTSIANEMARTSGHGVIAAVVPGLVTYNSDAYRVAIAQMLTELEPSYVCVPGTLQGLDFAPGLAVRLGMNCISGVARIQRGIGEPTLVRSLFNGKINAQLASGEGSTMIIVQPGEFRPFCGEFPNPCPPRVVTIDWKPTHTRSLEYAAVETADSELGEASVIVSAGRGMRKQENLELIQKVASLFPKSSVAGSRPICDLGWLPYKLQVGQTGTTVAPDLYLACGISGAQQHLAGMRGAKFIVAVNTDPDAAIFNEADIAVVEDLEGFLSDLIEESREQ